MKIVICNPIRSYWDHSIQGTCLNQPKIFLSDLSLAILTDLIILFVPIPLIWKLSMPISKKLKISVLLGAGGVATGVTIYRLYKVIKLMGTEDFAKDFSILDTMTYDLGWFLDFK